jgi:hypothetical protein
MKYTILLSLVLLSACSAGDYEPWVKDQFFFHSVGESREYKITVPVLSRPEVVVYDKGCELPKALFKTLPSGAIEGFSWEILTEVLKEGKVLESQMLEPTAVWHGESGCYKSVSFKSLDSITWKLFPSEVTIRLSVKSTDPRYAKESSNLSIGIRNSPVP